jgi:hypothetical protein
MASAPLSGGELVSRADTLRDAVAQEQAGRARAGARASDGVKNEQERAGARSALRRVAFTTQPHARPPPQ